MQTDDTTTVTSIHGVPDGGLIIFDVDGETHIGLKVVGATRGGPHIATFRHPDCGGLPGLWVYGVATGDSFLNIPNATFRPTLAPSALAIQWNKGVKAGTIVKTANELLLAVHTNRSQIEYIDLQSGQLYQSLPSNDAFVISEWQVIVPHPNKDELIFEFPAKP